MKKKLLLAAILVGLTTLTVACGKNVSETKETPKKPEIIKVASHMTPMTDVVEIAGKELKKEGYELELVQVNDNIQYNELLNNKEIDANFAQHEPFMMKYNSEKKGNLVAIQKIYNAKVGFYAKDAKTIEDIPEGAKVALPSDVSNEGRALAILADAGLIKLKDGVGFDGTLKDIIDNPKKLEWLSIDLLNLAEAYYEKDVAMVYDYPTYIAKIGLSPKDALISEKNIDERFAISLVAREDNKKSKKIVALKKAMTSPAVKNFLEKEHSDTLVPAF
ncbi:MetQ/NlpA family ABC transporter substrate-binding protein [Vagococcus intermedius]|uniref:MetQ/NlpA family ABC transporter substrate-binding protein n=1 Tax=Vagococcus intermedius TaxID=2991418 RepID=A0AAF0CVS8_9ENTE|nr:MetQ/NlpA family ABC transporter substrate-binding protein [Vagococcus intermedius]WEG73752.1 MetQ/NlpA family ABC transporter substrate-binding protein [Vagococcus intermedius]WEG75837.1 MetQ/NlpA family ABC transporter substrate-binding protein [Vagococcus intermedius]